MSNGHVFVWVSWSLMVMNSVCVMLYRSSRIISLKFTENITDNPGHIESPSIARTTNYLRFTNSVHLNYVSVSVLSSGILNLKNKRTFNQRRVYFSEFTSLKIQ